ncbi:MAG: hypothetical protein HYU66_22645 [Armatimonadetes bacterium]|nr:hypothetical protein [Armatimonadota bacterium]
MSAVSWLTAVLVVAYFVLAICGQIVRSSDLRRGATFAGVGFECRGKLALPRADGGPQLRPLQLADGTGVRQSLAVINPKRAAFVDTEGVLRVVDQDGLRAEVKLPAAVTRDARAIVPVGTDVVLWSRVVERPTGGAWRTHDSFWHIDLTRQLVTAIPGPIAGPCWAQDAGFAAFDVNGNLRRFDLRGQQTLLVHRKLDGEAVRGVSSNGRLVLTQAADAGVRIYRDATFVRRLRMGLYHELGLVVTCPTDGRVWYTTHHCGPYPLMGRPDVLWEYDLASGKTRLLASSGDSNIREPVFEYNPDTSRVLDGLFSSRSHQ